MSRAKKHQRPDPTAAELVDHIRRLPQRLGIWRAGQHGLYHLLFSSSLARMMDLARADHAGDVVAAIESAEMWRHATATLVEWHSRWAQPGSGEPLHQDVTAAIHRARDWRALETMQQGLSSGEMHISETNGWNVRLANDRDHAVEVLDIVLQQVSIPAQGSLAVPSAEAVHRWFADHKGQADAAHGLPMWIKTVMFRRALGDLVNRGLTMPADTDLGGLTLAEARECYALLLARTELADLCSTVLGCKDTAVWYSEPRRLQEALADHVNEESAQAFIRLCTYGPGRTPASAPLVQDGPLIAIPGALVSPVGFERALLRAASADPARGGQLGNALGRRSGRWADRLRTIPGALVAERLMVKDRAGQAIGDLDVVAFDPRNDLLFVVETKWPVDAQTLRESGKIDDSIEAGHRQVLRIKAALANGGTVQWPAGWTVKPTVRICWWVGTAQQLSSKPDREAHDIRASSLRLVEHVLPARSVADLQERLEHFPLPRLGSEYELIDQTVRADRYRVTFPAIAILGEPPIPPEDRRTNTGWT